MNDESAEAPIPDAPAPEACTKRDPLANAEAAKQQRAGEQPNSRKAQMFVEASQREKKTKTSKGEKVDSAPPAPEDPKKKASEAEKPRGSRDPRSRTPIRFLADESLDFRVVRGLRAAGYDVRAVFEDSPGAPDGEILESARSADRILLTEDRDFGQLVFARHASQGAGVVLVRCPETARARLPGARRKGLRGSLGIP